MVGCKVYSKDEAGGASLPHDVSQAAPEGPVGGRRQNEGDQMNELAQVPFADVGFVDNPEPRCPCVLLLDTPPKRLLMTFCGPRKSLLGNERNCRVSPRQRRVPNRGLPAQHRSQRAA